MMATFAPLAGASDPCSPPVRTVDEHRINDELIFYVVEYHFQNSEYRFVYQESNDIAGVQTHFDQGLGCTDAEETDTVITGHGHGGTGGPLL